MAPKTKTSKKGAPPKSIFKKPLFYAATLGTVGALALGTWGVTSYNKSEPPAPNPEPASIELSADSPAYAWLTSLETKSPSDAGGETPKMDRSRPLVPDLSCSVLKTAPKENLYTGDLNFADQDFTIQVLAPGTSGQVFTSIVKGSGSCWPKAVEQKEGETYRYVEAGEGFIAQIGDTLIYAPQSDEAKAKKFFDSISKSMTGATCLSTEVKDSDYTRNKHFSEDDYTGKMESEIVKSTLPLDKLPVVTVPELAEIEKPDAEEPEAPLDPSVPSAPDEVTKPTFSDRPEVRTEAFESEARYQVSDVEGPGCGWGWTAWELPTETAADFTKSKSAGVKVAQDAANAEADAYVNKQTDWAGARLSDSHDANAWNSYAKEFNAATGRWDWLNTKRAEVKPKWEKYVKAHDYWKNFEKIKSDEEAKYNTATQNCRDDKKAQEDWDERYDGTSGETGGDSGIPSRPAGCDKDPVAPSILKEERPKEPLPPKLDAGVTIPDSWDRPQ